MFFTLLYFFCLAAGIAFSLPISSKPTTASLNVVSRQSIPEDFAYQGPAADNETLTLMMAMRADNVDGLEERLYDVSTPSSALYGQWLTKDQVNSYMVASASAIQSTENWLKLNNLKATPFSLAGSWLKLNISVVQANELFGANFSVFTNVKTGTEVIRTLSYSMPAEIQGDVDLIHPTVVFPVQAQTGAAAFVSDQFSAQGNNTDGCVDVLTPKCVQQIYNMPSFPNPEGANLSQIAVPAYGSQFARRKDFTTFLQTFRPDVSPNLTFIVSEIDGGHNSQARTKAGFEANIDVQYTAGLTGGIPTTFISIGGRTQDQLSGFMDIVEFLLEMENPPQVFTSSYSFNEKDIMDSKLLKHLCIAYLQLSARGITVLFSSGDFGVAGSDRHGKDKCDSFLPSFPASCPFVTSVGGTAGINPEVGANLSSGGFSNIFGTPRYQTTAVGTYLKSIGNLNSGRFNSAGRAYPDIAAQAGPLAFVSGAKYMTEQGTSFSAPIIASIISLLNAELIAAGKPVAGFINPFIYANPNTLNDITSGSNPGCGSKGFPAMPGWDAVTGMGTPDYIKLRAAFGL